MRPFSRQSDKHCGNNMAETKLALVFEPSVDERTRKRINHAWRNYLAVYGYASAIPGTDGVRVVRYGTDVPARYGLASSATVTQWQGETLALEFGTRDDGRPDWLGEMFARLALEREWTETARDSVGRVVPRVTRPSVPEVSILMAWLDTFVFARPAPVAPASPYPGIAHVVVCSHDIDYYWTNPLAAAKRLLKNAAIALLALKDQAFFFDSIVEIARLLAGSRTGDLAESLAAAGRRHDFRSSVFVIARSTHRRDANYRPEQIKPKLARLERSGFSLELHGSYRSIVDERDLTADVEAFRRAFGTKPSGGRQHWLRYDSPRALFDAVERAGFVFDSSVGFAERPGFRSQAACPFVPYDLANERPYGFLEIPLAVMDGSLVDVMVAEKSAAKAELACEEVLERSRRWGWGGISVLWHNPMRPVAVSSPVNRIFWKLLERKDERREKWVSAADLCEAVGSRFAAAGLPLGQSAGSKRVAGTLAGAESLS